MNLRILSIVTTGLAVLFLVLLLTRGCDSPTTPPSDSQLWREKVAMREAVIKEKDSIIAAISEKRELETSEHLRVTTGLKQREAALVRKLKEANADIKVIADSLPRVARYIELADSTIAVKDSLYIRELNHSLATEALYKSEIAAMGEKYLSEQQKSAELVTTVTDLESQNGKLSKQLKRKQGWNNFWKGLAAGAIAAGTVVIITSQ